MKKIRMDLPDNNDYRMVEGMNQLKTNLMFSGDNIHSITITSSVPNEGKSSVAFNLARTLAENEKKILLVDCDLRKSVMVGKYHMEGVDKGMTHYLTGQATYDEVIYATEEDGFYIAVAGPLSPDPIRLLNSKLFENFVKYAKERFDYVVIDTPPLGLVVDAVIIGQITDGAVVVIEQGVIKKKIVQDVVKQLKMGDIRILGAVLNKIDEKKAAYGNYKYGYGYYGDDGKGRRKKRRRSMKNS